MNAHLSGSRLAIAGGVLRRVFPLVIGLASAVAGAQSGATDMTVTVFADRLLAADRTFGDLDRLDEMVTATRPRGITLNTCGPGVTRSLMAAAHRFQNLPLRLNALQAGEPGCPDASDTPASAMRVRQGPGHIDDHAVDRYWSQLMP